MTAVTGSGIRVMSDSLIAFQPAIDEPSNITPSAKVSSSMIDTSKVTCCHLPRGSVKRRSTYLTSLSLIDCRTSLAVVMGFPTFFAGRIPDGTTAVDDWSQPDVVDVGCQQEGCRSSLDVTPQDVGKSDSTGLGERPARGRGMDGQIASRPDSPVRMRTASSILETKILPSPIRPVCAARRMASIAFSTRSSEITISIFTLGRKSTMYSAPR